MAEDAAKGIADLIRHPVGHGFVLGVPIGMVVGGALVWYFVLPGEADKRSAVLKYQLERAEHSTKAEQAKTKEANNISDNLKKQLDQLSEDIAKLKAAEPVAEWFMWESDKTVKVLHGLEFSLYLTPTLRG